MSGQHLVRVGAFGLVGEYASVDGVRYPRGAKVIVRTERGLETGEVLAEPDPMFVGEPVGQILRWMTPEDELLASRLAQNRDAAFEACRQKLAVRGLGATLIDVEPLFDGRTLVFHFLGETDAALDALTTELAEAYDAKAKIRRFADTLVAGCGPDCGTDKATGGCGSCATGCAIAGACSAR